MPPKLDLHVRPKLGEREVTFCHVTEWIEKKLQDEFQVKEKMGKSWQILSAVKSVLISSLTFLPFQRVFVLPNMDDIYLPLMHSGVDCPQTGQQQSSRCPCSPSSSAESIQRIPAESDQCLTDQRTKTQETEEIWRICASEGERVLSLMFTSRTIQCEITQTFLCFLDVYRWRLFWVIDNH